MSKVVIRWPDAPAGGPWHFPGIPGVYAKDVDVALKSTGCTQEEMQAVIDAHPGCGLAIVEIEPKAAAKKTAGKEA